MLIIFVWMVDVGRGGLLLLLLSRGEFDSGEATGGFVDGDFGVECVAVGLVVAAVGGGEMWGGDDGCLVAVAGFAFECYFKADGSGGVVVVEGPEVGDEVDVTSGGDVAVDVDVGYCEGV